MSSMKDELKNKVRSERKSAHAQLIEPTTDTNENVNVDVNSNVDVNENVNVDVNSNVDVNVIKPKRKRFEEIHTRATFFIENELLNLLNIMAGEEKGEKTRIVNEALRKYLKTKMKT